MTQEIQKQVFKKLLQSQVAVYIVVQTKFTTHHIERTNYSDRGRWKWIAEMNLATPKEMAKDKEARHSHIDGQDLFPRLYFLVDSMVEELFAWLMARGLEVTNITTPRI